METQNKPNKNKSIMVVASLHQMLHNGEKYDREHTKVVRDRTVVQRSFVNDFNAVSDQSGKFYTIDEEKTVEYNKKAVEIREQRKENEAVSKQTAELLKDVVKSGMDNTPKTAKAGNKKADKADTEKESEGL